MTKKPTKQQKGFQEGFEKLVTLGKTKGFLTYDEVNNTLSQERETSSEEIDHIFDSLESKGIRIIDDEQEPEEDLESSPRADDLKRISEDTDKDPVSYEDKFIPLDDPVKMYLKQMGSIPLLSREKEILLAKKIEETENRFAESLFRMALCP